MKFKYMGQTVDESCKTSDLDQAKQLLEKRRHDIYERVINPHKYRSEISADTLLSHAIETCYTERWTHNKSGEQSYKQAMEAVEIIGDIPVASINTETIRNYRLSLSKSRKVTQTTINRYMAALRTVIHHTADVNPDIKPPKFRLTKETEQRIITYTKEEELQAINWFKSQKLPEMADLIAALVDTGLRLSEVLGLYKNNLKGNLISEYRDGSITSWDNKGNKPRTILTTRRVSSILSRYPNGFNITKRSAEYLWDKCRKALEFNPDADLHCFRHTCATRLLQGGMSLRDVQEWLGHASITTTQRYLHCVPNSKQLGVAILEEAV